MCESDRASDRTMDQEYSSVHTTEECETAATGTVDREQEEAEQAQEHKTKAPEQTTTRTEATDTADLSSIVEQNEDDEQPEEQPQSGTSTITVPPSIAFSASVSRATSVAEDSPMSTTTAPASLNKGPVIQKRNTEVIGPLFTRTTTSEKPVKTSTKSMIVETETVDSSNIPSVTLPIALPAASTPNEMVPNGSANSTNLSSLRSRRSTVFVDQNQAVNGQQVNSNPAHDNDNLSISGSIRNRNRHIAPVEGHVNITKPGATKVDLFAAKIANAVGDGSNSDSEETFVYESAPDGLNTVNTLPATKATASLASSNVQTLRNQRNLSMPMAPSHAFSPLSTPQLAVNNEMKERNTPCETEDDADLNPNGNDQSTITRSQAEQLSDNGKTPITRFTGKTSRDPSTTSFTGGKNTVVHNKPSQLRTATSKLFDVNGSTLRRYSGVPDDVNIEDYIDQYDEENEIESTGGFADIYDYEDYEEDDELTPLNLDKANNNLRNKMSRHYLNRKNFSNFGSTDNGTLSDLAKDEGLAPPFSKPLRGKRTKLRSNQQYLQQEQHSPHNFFNNKKNTRIQLIKNIMYLFMFVFGLLSFGFITGFLLATTKDLQDVQILSIDDVLLSFEELVFDLNVQAFNPGFLSIAVSEVELDIFAKSSYVDKVSNVPIFDKSQSDYQTILLGTATRFEIPLEFASGLFSRNHSQTKSAVKLLHPGRNYTGVDGGESHKVEDDSDKWREIIEHPFELIVRGSFKYEIPLFRTERSVPVTKSVPIDPDAESSVVSLSP